MDRRTLLGSMGALALATPAGAQDTPHWSAPVIDMHFHMRRTPELNIAHQTGAGVTAANLLTQYSAAPQVAALQAQKPNMFACWFGAADVSRPDAESLLTQAVKSGAKGLG